MLEKWLNAEKAIFLQCCGTSQDTSVTSNGRIREGYMEEIEVELDLYRLPLGWQGRKSTLGEEPIAKA